MSENETTALPVDDNKLMAERRQKLAALRAQGNPFPNDFRRDAHASDLQATFGEKPPEWFDANPMRVRVAGRMLAKRDMGKSSFVRLVDGSGEIQLYLQGNLLGEVYSAFKGWDVGDIVGASGLLMRTRTGELSVKADELRLLTKSLRPLPDKWHGLTDTEARYRMRYVDLIVNPVSRKTFETRTQIIRYIRSFLDTANFMEVETPMMQPIPGGAVARPFVTHHNALDMEMYLRIAPELYLKRLVVGGFERVYEINRNFRNEGLSTRHNPEFTMLELYWAYADYHELMDLVERLFMGIAVRFSGRVRLSTKAQRLTSPGRFGGFLSKTSSWSATRRSSVGGCGMWAICARCSMGWVRGTRPVMAPANYRSRSLIRPVSRLSYNRPSSMPIQRKYRRCRAAMMPIRLLRTALSFSLVGVSWRMGSLS